MPIQGTEDLDPFFLNFGRHALPLEVISLQLPPHPTSSDTYAEHLVQRLATAHKQFQAIKSDLRRSQRKYDFKSRTITIPPGKQVHMQKHFIGQKGLATRFIRNFDGPLTVIGSYNQRSDLLKLRAINGDIVLPVNVEKLVVVPADNESNILPDDLAIDYEHMEPGTAAVIPPNRQNHDLQTIALHFAKYLLTYTENKAFTSQACKQAYRAYPPAREILSRYRKLGGLISQCPYLSMQGAAQGGTYTINLDKELFDKPESQ